MIHTFAGVVASPNGMKVVELFDNQITELDVIGVYAKVIDVGARSTSLVAPSFTPKARELAESYGMMLESSLKLSR